MHALSNVWAAAFRAAGLLVGAAALAGTLAAAAQAQGRIVRSFGAWDVTCDTPAGAQGEQCALIQSVWAEDRENIALHLVVLRTADHQLTLLRAFAPLGVLLPSGLGLSIDGVEFGVIEFVRCLYPEGCMIELILEGDLFNRLSGGTTALFRLFLTPEAGIGIPIALAGFTQGLNALP